jgi:iron complex outermembrane receptor protein
MGNRMGACGSARSRGFRLALLSACCIGALSVEAGAQTTEEIIVTANRALAGTKTDTRLTEIPQSISVVTAQEFNDRAAVNFQDIFRYSAGVASELNGVDVRGDFFAARGFPTVQYLDGLNRMPSFVYGARLDIFTVERAEVLRGPSAVLYGAGGAGGLFNAVSKRPRDEFGGEIGVQYGTNQRKQVQFDVTGALADGISARLVGVGRDGNMAQSFQDDNRALINPSITFRPTDSTEITLIGIYQKDKNGTQTYLPISKTAEARTRAEAISFDTFLGEPDFNHMKTEYYSGTILLKQKFGDNIEFNSRNRAFHENVDYQEIYAGYTYEDAARRRPSRAYYVLNEDYKGFNSDNNLLARFDTGPLKHQVLVGLDYTWFKQDRAEGFGGYPGIDAYNPVYGATAPTSFVNFPKTTSSQLGLYAQDQIRAFDRVSIVLGARHDHTTSKTRAGKDPNNNAWTYRAGVIADLTETISPYFSYSESFLPVFGTNFFGVAFKPREGRQYEGGVKWVPVPGALITASVFDIKESNYVTSDPNEIQNFIQTGSVGSKGVEIEGTIRLPKDFEVTASYTYTRAKMLTDTAGRTGFRVDNLPQHQASAWGAKTFVVNNDITAKAGAGVRYTGNKVDFYENYQTDPTTLVDAMFELDYRAWSFSVNASNIFDTNVYTNCGAPPGLAEGYCYLGSGRTVLATLRRRF